MILGISAYHDSSIALADLSGRILYGVAEERFTRKKNDARFPHNSLRWLQSKVKLDDIRYVVVAGQGFEPVGNKAMSDWYFRDNDKSMFDGQRNYRFPPGFREDKTELGEEFHNKLRSELLKYNINASITFVDHHVAHAFSGIATSGFENGLVITLDGEGDGRSGLTGFFQYNDGGYFLDNLRSISIKNSLGYLYSATTSRYNFKRYSHEGKITGLASFGSPGPSLDILRKYIWCSKGLPSFDVPTSGLLRTINYGLRKSGIQPSAISCIEDVVENAARVSLSFEELASSTQAILQEVVLDMLRYVYEKHGKFNCVLAGGVFSNVRLNQLIASSEYVDRLYIYPNMGDGGLCVGAIYKFVSDQKWFTSSSSFEFEPYIGPEIDIDKSIPSIKCNSFADRLSWIQYLVSQLRLGKVIGLVQGRSEFGPRALMNRSIICEAVNSSINEVLNIRLRRTDFMPFAPVVREERLTEVFDVADIADLRPFYSMTMTCLVNKAWREKIPAVVHVDGTARPQVVTREKNPISWELLREYERRTGIPCLVNTSFNVHEEPIVNSIEDLLYALQNSLVDFVASPNRILEVVRPSNIDN